MTIILIRHGETDLNRARVLQPPQTPLSALGQQQATLVAKRLREKNIDCLLSSDMTRAAQTAAAIARELQLPVEYSTTLHERNFGDLRGTSYDELNFNPMASDYAPPNGESWPEFRQRVANAFAEVLRFAESSRQTLAVVSHGLVIKEIAAQHLQLTQAVPDHFENTCITVFDKSPPHRAALVADARHLSDLQNSDKHTGSQGAPV